MGMILANKTVLVTGVGGGLGRECAASALRDGANVVLAARTGSSLEEIAAELDQTGERVAVHVTDITDPESCASLVDTAQRRFGSVDALIQVARSPCWAASTTHPPCEAMNPLTAATIPVRSGHVMVSTKRLMCPSWPVVT